MKTDFHLRALATILLAGLLSVAVAAQNTGAIEFTARVAPSAGRPEPVRQMTFYLLSKSLDDVRAEAAQAEPAPDLDKFIAGLTVSRELKAWMKKNETVKLSGTEFTKSLTPDDILNVPEFFKAYMSHNIGFKGIGLPEPKFKEKDQDSNPEKYKKEHEEYLAALRKFLVAVPQSTQGIDVELDDDNPGPKWELLQSGRAQRLDALTIDIAQQHYIAASADSDLDGHGLFAGVPPGSYWISMVSQQAISGDVRLRWDLPVSVRPGQTTHVDLSNLNAMRPAYRAAQNANP